MAKTTPPRLKRSLEAPAVLFGNFVQLKTSGSIVLILCTVAAMVWANSRWADSYTHIWHTPLTLSLGGHSLSMGLSHWINDALMTLFFLYVGLEIKRELLVGELSSLKKSMLPIMAAVGGMLVPAAIFAFFNAGTNASGGWGIPMATDIAFSLGVLSLLGARVPLGIKVFLSALAIADDLGAVVVIALFYGKSPDWSALAIAAILLVLMFLMLRSRYRQGFLLLPIAIVIWYMVLVSGIHATIAGVLMAMVIPATTRINSADFIRRTEHALGRFKGIAPEDRDTLRNPDSLAHAHVIRQAASFIETPLQKVEHALSNWVAFFIMPVFALANAGVAIDGSSIGSLILHPVNLGVALGLVVGKQVGVTFFSWLSIRLGMASLPAGVSMKHLYAVSWLCGIGFTMSLFVSELAFTDAELKETAKLGILLGSLVSGLAGFIFLKLTLRKNNEADENEAEAVRSMEPDTALVQGPGEWQAGNRVDE